MIENRVDDVKRTYPEIASKLDELIALDPTPQKKYLMWMAKQITENDYDLFIVSNAVTTFHVFQSRMPPNMRDINAFEYVDDLTYAVQEVISKKSQEKDVNINQSGGKIVASDDKFKLVKIETREAACNLGRGTRWCISGHDSKFWTKYTQPEVVNLLGKSISVIYTIYFLIPVSASAGDKLAITVMSSINLSNPAERSGLSTTYIWDKTDKKIKYSPYNPMPGLDLFTKYTKTDAYKSDMVEAQKIAASVSSTLHGV